MATTSMEELAAAAAGGARVRGLYDEDFWGWTQEQACALRRRDVGAIDWDNVIEEVETLGRSEKSFWTSHCANVISHLLKIEHSAGGKHFDHWRKEIEDWRWKMHRKLRSSPSVKGSLPELLGEAWEDGRAVAVRKLTEEAKPDSWAAEQTVRRGLELRLPGERPYSLVEIASYNPYDKDAKPDPDVWPPTVAQRLNEVLGADYAVRRWGWEQEAALSR